MVAARAPAPPQRGLLRGAYRWAAVLRLQPPRHGPWRRHDRALRQRLRAAPAEAATYHWIFRYLLTGWLEWRTADRARVNYPGLRSRNALDGDRIEGFARFLPVIGAWLAGGRPARVEDLEGRPVDLPAVLAEGLVAGSDPTRRGYWGRCWDRDQRQVEAADVALGLWLARAQVWPLLTTTQRAAIGDWLAQAAARPVWDSNWHLFPLLVTAVLAALELPAERGGDAAHLERLRAFHRGDGWFEDGADWAIDYYNAWGFHYGLAWLERVEPGASGGLLRATLPPFARGFSHVFSPAGVPLLGRSLTYRLALPAPLIAAQHHWPAELAPGLARRALAAVWARYGLAGALRAGLVTQGVEGLWLPLIDGYTGPGAPLWSLRSLVLALAEPDDAPFWTQPLEPLPVERGDFRLELPAIGWSLTGRQADGEIEILRHGEVRPARFRHGGLAMAWHALAKRGPRVPENRDSRYFQARYSIHRPFWR